ncbi:hypothetical protein [Streptomyces sp. x-80]|uniref:hypothetical protein n=1 Tax=Streptomyces sp. x-80 TaxID=2789282 RepID=UPI00397F35B5
MAARYEVLQTNMMTGEAVASLPVTAIRYTESLNAAGSAAVTIPLNAPEADGSLYPVGTGLVVVRDSEPVWGGILWTLNADLAGGTLTLNASGYHSYYSGRFLENGYDRAASDQSLLLTEWVEYANDNGGISTDTSYLSPTGGKRSRKWFDYEYKNIGEAIDELADDFGGFNFRYVPYWADRGKRVGNRLLKSARGDSLFPYQLQHGVNCNVTAVSYDGSSLATTVTVFGADNGAGGRPRAQVANPGVAGRIPRKAVTASYSDVKDSGSLVPKAAALAAVGRTAIAVPTLTLYPGLFSPTEFTPGDTGTVIAESGYVALFDEFVVTERAVDVDDNGTESISLAMANKEVFASGNSD